MPEDVRLRVAGLEEGFSALPSKVFDTQPGKLFDDAENILRITVPDVLKLAEKSALTIPGKFKEELEVMQPEKALLALRDFAEARFKELNKANIRCDTKVVYTDVQLKGLEPSARESQKLFANQNEALLIITPKISSIKFEDLATDEQRVEYFRSCIELFQNLLVYYKDQRSQGLPILWDIAKLKAQYAYTPGKPDKKAHFTLVDTDLRTETSDKRAKTFLSHARTSLEEARSDMARHGEALTEIDRLIKKFESEQETLPN